MNPKKLAKILVSYIELVDSHRAPARFALRTQLKLGILWELKGTTLLSEYDPEFEGELVHEIRSFLKERMDFALSFDNMMKSSIKPMALSIILIFAYLIFILPFFPLRTYFDTALFASVFIFIIILSMFLVIRAAKKYKNIVAKANDEKLRDIAQRVIDYSINFFEKNGINPRDFPIDLRHEDYANLSYEKMKEKYTAHLDMDDEK